MQWQLMIEQPVHRMIVGVTGASGAPLAVRLMHLLSALDNVKTHLIVSDAAKLTLAQEVGPCALGELLSLSTRNYSIKDIGADIASGSFPVHGMIIAPCSMRTLAAISSGISDNLITRAADVQLKERRKLILMARETPLHLGHLRNMLSVTEMGAVVMPPTPAFYHQPKSLDEVCDHIARRCIDQLRLPAAQLSKAWQGN